MNPGYGKQVAVFAVAVATGDIIKYQSFVYGSFVLGIHVRYNNIRYPYPECKNNMFWFAINYLRKANK